MTGAHAAGSAIGGGRSVARLATLAVAAFLPALAAGQAPTESTTDNSAGGRAWTVIPRITAQETFTDNVALSNSGRVSDQITELSPGVNIKGKTARANLYLDYSLRQLWYAQGTRGSETQNALNSFGNLEIVEKLFFVDASGVISRQNISAFGAPSAANYSVNANSTETSSYRLSPYAKGRIGTLANYEVRYSWSTVRAKGSSGLNSDVGEWLGRLSGDTALAKLGWSVDAGRQNYHFQQGRKNESERLRGMLGYQIDPQLRLSVSAGREANDFLTVKKESWNTYGYGADWVPGERTQVSVFREKRFFGFGHSISVSHRLPLSAIKYTDVRDVTTLPNQFATVGLGNIYDILFAQMASAIPDPNSRAIYVTNLLQQNGIAPNSQVVSGFLTSQVSKQRRQELSYVLRGTRNTLTLAFARAQNDNLSGAVGLGDDFSVASSIRQQGFNVGLAHQLGSQSSLNVTGSRMRSTGVGTGAATAIDLATTQTTLTAGVSTRLGAHTTGAITARRTVFDGTTNYTENALIGTLTYQF